MGGKSRDGALGALLGRVEKRQVADQDHVTLVVDGQRTGACGIVLAGHAQHAHALVGQLGRALDHGVCQRFIKRQYLPVDLHLGADAQDLFQGALAHHARAALCVAHDHRKAAALKVKRQLVDAVVALAKLLGGKTGSHGHLVGAFCQRALDDGVVDEVLHARREVAVEKRVAQHAGVLAAVDVQVALKDDAILGQGPGLIGAQNVDGTQVLDGVQALYDHMVARQVYGALAQAGGDQHRQHLGREAHGHRQREEQGRQPVVLGEARDDKHDGKHNEHQPHEQAAGRADPLVKRCVAFATGQRSRRLAKHGALTRCHNHAAGVARDDG